MQSASLSSFLPAAAALGFVMAAQPAQADLEFSAYGGPQWVQPGTLRSPTLGNDRVTWRGEPFTIPPYYGLRAAWWQSESYGYGMSFTHAKAFANDPARHGYDELNFSHGLNFLTVDVWHRLESRGDLTPYVGLGLGVVVPHVEVTPMGQASTVGYQVGGPSVSLVLGMTRPVTDRWSVFTEFMVNYSDVRADLTTGDRIRTDFVTHAVNIGLSYRF